MPQTPALTLAREPTLALGQSLFPTLVVLVTFFVFVPVLKNGFVDADSSPLVNNLSYRGLGWPQLQWMFGGFHFGLYQPLAWLTLGLDHILWWADPFGHHLMNLVLHVGNAALFYRFTLELFSFLKAANQNHDRTWMKVAAGIAALGFAIHPLRVESVALASGRGELVAAGFFLFSLFGYLKVKAMEDRQAQVRWLMVSLMAFSFSLLASPSGLVLPVVILVIESYRLEWMATPPARLWAEAGRLLWQKAPYFLLSVACIGLTIFARSYSPIIQSTYREDFLAWTLHQLAAPALYLWNAILPVSLSPAYELRGWHLALYVAATGIICAVVFNLRKRWPALAPAWLCYLVLLLPFFRGEFPAEQVLADRYTYLASLPLALLVGAAAGQCRHARPGRGSRTLFWGAGIISALTAAGVLAWKQIPVWRDAETLWINAAAVNPTSRAYFNLATLAEAQGKYDDAIAFNRRLVEINPSRWDAHERAAGLLQRQGKIAEAVEHYQVVVRLNPSSTEARENLAAGLVHRGEIAEGIQHFRKILELDPGRNETRFKLGTILAVQGRLAEAAETLTAAAKADSHDGRILLRLGQVLAAQGKLAEALPYFREAVRLRSEDAEAHENLGRALLELGEKDEAAKHLQEALRIMRSRPTAR